MKILHTSDWHLGRSLYGRKRYEEFTSFLDWLSKTIKSENIDILLVAGDVFDTSTPGNHAQKLYYRFLCHIAHSSCHHIVIIAGNHDSPSFLAAPKELLQILNVYVIGTVTAQLKDEVLVLSDKNNHPEAIICAVPYLRDKDIRTVEAGETIEDKNSKLIKGIHNHYSRVCQIAEQTQTQLEKINKDKHIPIIAMGHLFTAGGKINNDDGVRELYVGSLAHVSQEIFPKSIDYLALGHLHVPQRVAKNDYFRYCGSPIPMGYGEAKQKKKVIIVEFNEHTPLIQEVTVPCFQALERIAGSLEEILSRLKQLKLEHSNAWLEIEYTGQTIISDLRTQLVESLSATAMEILCIKNKRIIDHLNRTIQQDETLDNLDEYDVFERCLDSSNIAPEDRTEMRHCYKEIVNDLYQDDPNAE